MNRLQEIDLETAYWRRERMKLIHPLKQLSKINNIQYATTEQ